MRELLELLEEMETHYLGNFTEPTRPWEAYLQLIPYFKKSVQILVTPRGNILVEEHTSREKHGNIKRSYSMIPAEADVQLTEYLSKYNSLVKQLNESTNNTEEDTVRLAKQTVRDLPSLN